MKPCIEPASKIELLWNRLWDHQWNWPWKQLWNLPSLNIISWNLVGLWNRLVNRHDTSMKPDMYYNPKNETAMKLSRTLQYDSECTVRRPYRYCTKPDMTLGMNPGVARIPWNYYETFQNKLDKGTVMKPLLNQVWNCSLEADHLPPNKNMMYIVHRINCHTCSTILSQVVAVDVLLNDWMPQQKA